MEPRFRIAPTIVEALDAGRPVVALETTIVVHGLPHPANLETAAECEAAISESGALPATIGLLDGEIVVGLSNRELEHLCEPASETVKLSARDLGVALALDRNGATTVAGTIAVAHACGIAVMATGGIGGVHRGAHDSYDESADLTALARYGVVVVASGAKSILDIPATLERLDSLGVPVLGYGVHNFPAFYLHDSAIPLDWRVNDPTEVARAFAHHRRFSPTAMFVANPIPLDHQLDPAVHERALQRALDAVESEHVSGKRVTPVMLDTFARETGHASVAVNRELVVANARLAGQIAVALSALE